MRRPDLTKDKDNDEDKDRDKDNGKDKDKDIYYSLRQLFENRQITARSIHLP